MVGLGQLQCNGLHFAWRAVASGGLLYFNICFEDLEEMTGSTVAVFANDRIPGVLLTSLRAGLLSRRTWAGSRTSQHELSEI